jgi:hypothetical protein
MRNPETDLNDIERKCPVLGQKMMRFDTRNLGDEVFDSIGIDGDVKVEQHLVSTRHH